MFEGEHCNLSPHREVIVQFSRGSGYRCSGSGRTPPGPLAMLAIYDSGKPHPINPTRKLADHCYSQLLACDGQKSNRATVRLRAGP